MSNLALPSLLPRVADNDYKGFKIALWLFGAVVLLKAIVGINSTWMGYSVASNADGIPLNTFPAEASREIVVLFAVMGVSQLAICLICAMVLIRYRALIPFMFAVLLLEFLGRTLVRYLLPVSTAAAPGSWVTLALFVLIVAGFALSLFHRPGARATP
ncbi:MAG TPA: hypothetical protein VFW34_08035 [Candidatus Rubrimentiphilum sp.]|nr:hypothetical protein [Candidatus Rubrimentiphilum sp.]